MRPKQGRQGNGRTFKQAVIYARVSSKDQEKEGFSIPAQLKFLRRYAQTSELAVDREFVDVETAKKTGRAGFGEMPDEEMRKRMSDYFRNL